MSPLNDKWFYPVLLLILLFIVPIGSIKAQPAQKTDDKLWQQLTTQEKKYLSEHPNLSVQSEANFPPINFISNDQPSGFSIDFMRLLGTKLGVEIDFVSGHNWPEFMSMLKSGEMDLMINIVKSPQRAQHLLFTTPVANAFLAIVTTQSRRLQLDSLSKLNGKTIALVKGYIVESMIRQHFPMINIRLVSDVREALSLVANNEVDASIQGNSTINYLIGKYDLHNLSFTNVTDEPRFPALNHHIAMSKNNPLLQSIINKGIKQIDESQLIALRTKWFGSSIDKQKNYNRSQLISSLSEQEKQYLASHPVIKVQNEDNYPPFNYTVNGQPNGYSVDYIRLITQNLGIEVEFVQGKSWSEYVQMLKDKQLDAMINMMETPSRQDYANFTLPYLTLSTTVVTRKANSSATRSRQSLSKQRIVVIEGYASGAAAKKVLPNTHYIVAKDTEAALQAIANNTADALLHNGAVINYYIEKNFSTGFALSPLPDDLHIPTITFQIASRKDNAMLTNILQKSMNTVSEIDMIQLRKKWFTGDNQQLPSVSLTAQERDYLALKGSLNVNSGLNYPPFTFMLNQVEQGFSIDLVRHMADILNVKLNFIAGSWPQHLKHIQTGAIDFLLDSPHSESDTKLLRFTQPYLESRNILAMREDPAPSQISFAQLNGKTVAALKGWTSTIHLEKHYPDINLHYVKSPLDALLAVSSGKADAHIISELLSNYLIGKHFISNLTNIPLVGSAEDITDSHAFAVAPEQQLLRNILDKTLLAVTETKLIELRSKWFGKLDSATQFKLKLNRQQRQWLANNQQLKFVLPAFGLPLAEKSAQGFSGILAEFVNYFEDTLSTRWLSSTHTDMTSADMTIGNPQNPFLKNQFNFSQPLVRMPIVILTGNPKRVYVDDLTELDGIKTGILGDVGYQSQIQQSYPSLQLQKFDTMTSAVLAVNSGDVDVLLCPLAHCSYLINELGANNVRIVGQTGFYYNLSFAIRKDWPELLQIVDITLAAMSPQLKNGIFKHWNSREDLLVKVDYSRFWYLLVVAVIIIASGIVWNRKIAKYAQTVEIAHDELKNAQAQLVHSEKMASLGVLTAGVAHEINNPTNFAYVGVHNLEVDLAQCRQYIFDLAGEQAETEVIQGLEQQFNPLFEHINTVKDGIDRIKIIVQDLAAFTRLDHTTKIPVDIGQCIQSTLNLVRSKHLKITEFVTDFKPTPKFCCHQAQINQVLMNLIVNACDAIKDKQRRQNSTSLGKITLACESVDNHIEVSISDDGCGMSEETKNKLFEPFYTTKGVGEGTGLGMAISFGIIEEHGGTIEVESTQGVGSVIRVRLPLTE